MSEEKPVVGSPLNVDDIEGIIDRIEMRKHLFPDEPWDVTIGVVMANHGDAFTQVVCVGGEWSGLKKDLPHSTGIPRCPQGHVLTESSDRIRIGWVEEDA